MSIPPARRRRRKSSLRVSVVLLGAAALSACEGEPQYTNRDMYASVEECQRDWGRPENCEPGYRSGPGSARVWHGPRYQSGSSISRSPRSIGTTSTRSASSSTSSRSTSGSSSTSRGGFGSRSSFHSSGG